MFTTFGCLAFHSVMAVFDIVTSWFIFFSNAAIFTTDLAISLIDQSELRSFLFAYSIKWFGFSLKETFA